jgi:hypothetical protein
MESNCVISSYKQKSLLATQVDRLYLFHEYLEYHQNIHSHFVELFPVRHIIAVRINKVQRNLLKVTGLYQQNACLSQEQVYIDFAKVGDKIIG